MTLNYSYGKVTDNNAVYRGTEVCKKEWDHYKLKTYWWFTNTTKKYINIVLPIHIRLVQEKGNWYIKYLWWNEWLSKVEYSPWTYSFWDYTVTITN